MEQRYAPIAGSGRSVRRSQPVRRASRSGSYLMSCDRVGYRFRNEIENQHPSLPPLAAYVDANLEYAPAALVKDQLRGSSGAGALVRQHELMRTGRRARRPSKISARLLKAVYVFGSVAA